MKVLHQDQLAQIKDPHIKMSLRLQAAFELRREEAINIIPRQADQGDILQLQASWKRSAYRTIAGDRGPSPTLV